MTAAQAIGLAIQVSMAIVIFCVALNARFGSIATLLRRPGLLLRSLISMLVVMPALAVGLALAFDLNPLVEAALIASALAPVPPILPGKQVKAGGKSHYVIGLVLLTSLFAIAYVPLAAHLLGQVFQRPVDVHPAHIVKIVATSMVLPVIAGMAVRQWAPAVADKIDGPLSAAAMVLLVVALIPVLIKEWPSIANLYGNFSLVAMAVFALAGLLVGHLLGGPNPDDRTVLALATCSRHPAVAMAIVHNAVDKPGLLAAVLLVLVVGSVVSVPYVKWRTHQHDAAQPHRPTHA